MVDAHEQTLLADAGTPVVAVDDGGLIEFANADALVLLGWDDALVGKPLTTIIPARLRSQHKEGFGRYVTTGESRLQGKTVRVPAMRRDGTETELDLTIRVFRRPDGTKLVTAALQSAATGRPPHGLVVIEAALVRRLYELI